jgi:hypothetical protein
LFPSESHGSEAAVLPNILLDVLSCRNEQQKECENKCNSSHHTDKDLEDRENTLDALDCLLHVEQEHAIVPEEGSHTVGDLVFARRCDVVGQPNEELCFWDTVCEVVFTNDVFLVELTRVLVQSKIVF